MSTSAKHSMKAMLAETEMTANRSGKNLKLFSAGVYQICRIALH